MIRRRAPAPGRQEASEATVDLVAFNCPRCSLALKPSVYLCAAGNLVCSTCYDRSRSSTTTVGYIRCFTVERMLEAVRVPCSNASRGCDAMTPYHRWADHQDSCPHSIQRLNVRYIPTRK